MKCFALTFYIKSRLVWSFHLMQSQQPTVQESMFITRTNSSVPDLSVETET